MYTSETFWFSDTIITMYIGPDEKYSKNKIGIIFLAISFDICFECSKEPSCQDVSFEYPQHIFGFRNKKINFQLCILIWRPVINNIYMYI